MGRHINCPKVGEGCRLLTVYVKLDNKHLTKVGYWGTVCHRFRENRYEV